MKYGDHLSDTTSPISVGSSAHYIALFIERQRCQAMQDLNPRHVMVEVENISNTGLEESLLI